MINFIQANKCELGGVYYLSGMWYQRSKALINTPVKFIGKGTNSNVGKTWSEHKGKHMFEFVKEPGRIVHAYADTHMLIQPIENPDIIKNQD